MYACTHLLNTLVHRPAQPVYVAIPLLPYIPQLIPGLSPTSWFTTVFPLACVLIFNAAKEGYDDYHRHRCSATGTDRELQEAGHDVCGALLCERSTSNAG